MFGPQTQDEPFPPLHTIASDQLLRRPWYTVSNTHKALTLVVRASEPVWGLVGRASELPELKAGKDTGLQWRAVEEC